MSKPYWKNIINIIGLPTVIPTMTRMPATSWQNGAYRALRGSSSLRKTEYASTWVYRIMLNECFRHMKRPQNLSYEYIKDAMKREPFYMEDKSENLDIRRALDSLSEQDKAVIVLRFLKT